MQKELALALKAANKASEVLLSYFQGSLNIRHKDGHSFNLVSEADLETERVVLSVIKETFPDHHFLAEESFVEAASENAKHLWIVDPLDGTNNFLHSLPQFSCSIAYAIDGVVQLGVVINPVTKELFTVVRGEGAFLNGKQVKVASTASFDAALIATGFYYDRGQMMECTLSAIRELFSKQIHGIRRFGASSLDLCFVGCGRFDAYFEYQLFPWDFAAGKLFVEEAGGMVTDAMGDVLQLKAGSILASNSLLHQVMSEITAKHCNY